MALTQSPVETLKASFESLSAHADFGLPTYMITEATNYYSEFSGEEFEHTTAKFGNTTPEKSRNFWNSFEGKVLKKEFLEEKIEELEELRHNQALQRDYLKQQRELAIIALSLAQERKKHQQEVIEYNESLDEQKLAEEQKRLDEQIAAYDKMIASLDQQIEEVELEIEQEMQALAEIEQEMQQLEQEQELTETALDESSYDDLSDVSLDSISSDLADIIERAKELENQTLQAINDNSPNTKGLQAQLQRTRLVKAHIEEQRMVKEGELFLNKSQKYSRQEKEGQIFVILPDNTSVTPDKAKQHLQDLRQYRSETGAMCHSAKTASYVLGINSHLVQTPDGKLSYYKDFNAYYNTERDNVEKAIEEGSIYMLDADNNPTMDITKAHKFNYLNQNQRAMMHEDGTMHVYDHTDPANPQRLFTTEEHATQRMDKKIPLIMTVRASSELAFQQRKDLLSQQHHHHSSRLEGLTQRKEMLVKSREVCTEKREHCIAQRKALSQESYLQSNFLSGLNRQEDTEPEIKEEEQAKNNPTSGMGR